MTKDTIDGILEDIQNTVKDMARKPEWLSLSAREDAALETLANKLTAIFKEQNIPFQCNENPFSISFDFNEHRYNLFGLKNRIESSVLEANGAVAVVIGYKGCRWSEGADGSENFEPNQQ